jgi:hypothetical protein
LAANIAADAAIGAAAGAVGSATGQMIDTGTISGKEVLASAVSGGIGAGAGRVISMGISAGIKNVVGAVKSKGIQLIDNFVGYATRSEGSIPNPTGMIDDVVNKVDDLADDIGTVKVGTKAATEGGVKTDFYVAPSGTAVPATGYRYMPREANYIDDLKNTIVWL